MAPRSFLPVPLPADGELGRGADRRRLRLLPAGVRVDLGVEHEDVDLGAERQHVVEAAEADVVGPPVAADDPHALRHQRVRGQGQAHRVGIARGPRARRRSASTRSRCAAISASVTGRAASSSSASVAPMDGASRRTRSRARASSRSTASRMPRPNSALSSNSELAQAGPRPAASCAYGVVGRLPP